MSEVEVDLDLDAARRARSEARGKPRTLRLEGQIFELAPEFKCSWLPLAESDDDTDGEVLLKEVLGDETERFLAVATTDDLRELGVRLLEVYGLGRGESKASNGSSSNSGGRSRRTSGASTGSASARSSGATTPSARAS